MTNIENKILESLYKKGKAISKGKVFNALNYYIDDILGEIGLSQEDADASLKILSAEKEYIEREGVGIKLTVSGLEYCLETYEKRKLGFLQGKEEDVK